MVSQKFILPVMVVAVAGAAVLGMGQVYAQSPGTAFDGLAQMIAQKFNLDQSQVQSTLDQFAQQRKTAMQETMQQREKSRLNQAVADGKITAAQQQAILDELAKLRTEYASASYKNMTKEQIQQQFQKRQDEITSWAKANGIDPSYVMPGFGMRKGGWMRHGMSSPAPTP